MEKIEALKILIDDSSSLDKEDKKKILKHMDSFTDEQIEELGTSLAAEAQGKLDAYDANIAFLDYEIEGLEKFMKDNPLQE